MVKGAVITMLIMLAVIGAYMGACSINRSVIIAAIDPIAECVDGKYSVSNSRRGTCSNHGGVKEWMR